MNRFVEVGEDQFNCACICHERGEEKCECRPAAFGSEIKSQIDNEFAGLDLTDDMEFMQRPRAYTPRRYGDDEWHTAGIDESDEAYALVTANGEENAYVYQDSDDDDDGENHVTG